MQIKEFYAIHGEKVLRNFPKFMYATCKKVNDELLEKIGKNYTFFTTYEVWNKDDFVCLNIIIMNHDIARSVKVFKFDEMKDVVELVKAVIEERPNFEKTMSFSREKKYGWVN